MKGQIVQIFRNLSLKGKLFAITIFLIACNLLAVGFAIFRMSVMDHRIKQVAEDSLPSLEQLNYMNYSSATIIRHMNSLLYITDKVMRDGRIKDAIEARTDLEEASKKYWSSPFLEGEEELAKNAEARWSLVNANLNLVLSALEQDGSLEQARAIYYSDEGRSARREYTVAMEKLIEVSNKNAHRLLNETIELSRSSEIFAGAAALISTVIGFLLAWAVSNQLAKNLSSLASQLSTGADDVAVASKQISNSSNQLSSAATEQASALQQSVSSIEEINAMVNKNAEGAKNSEAVSTQSHQAAERGQDAMNSMLGALGEISQSNQDIVAQIEETNREMSAIVQVIAEIGNKTKVINDIVFQTKLLSFNASVEAARAGEHGKGFAVVAEEVGSLAQMSGTAATEISNMLTTSMDRVENIVKQTEARMATLIATNREKTSLGGEKAQECASILKEIVSNVSAVNQMIAEIAVASQEQSRGVNEISHAMSQMDQVTQQNSAISQESAAASEQLAARADNLREAVQDLTLTIYGANHNHGGHSQQSSTSNVIPLKKEVHRSKKDQPVSRLVQKKASGDVPVETDPRFEDV